MRFFCAFWLWMFLSEFRTSTTEEIQGHIGRSITISCSHKLASDNRKYFCRDPCQENILVTSSESHKGRYTLKDSGNGAFSVTITDLQQNDSGIYWCGVDRSVIDTYNKVILTVTKGDLEEVTRPMTTQTRTTPRRNAEIHLNSHKPHIPRSSAFVENTPTSTGFDNESDPAGINTVPVHVILFASAGLAAVMIICAVGLVVCHCRKRAKKSRRVIARSIYSERHSTEESAVYENRPDNSLYASMRKSRNKSEEDSQSDSVYLNIHIDTTHEESIYGNVY